HLLNERDLKSVSLEREDQAIEPRQLDRPLPCAVALERMTMEARQLLQLTDVADLLDEADPLDVLASHLFAIGAHGEAGLLVLPLERLGPERDLHAILAPVLLSFTLRVKESYPERWRLVHPLGEDHHIGRM